MNIEQKLQAVQHGRIQYSSSWDRGLDNVLAVLPWVLDRCPDIQLHVYYGVSGWLKAAQSRGDKYSLDLIDSIQKQIQDLGKHVVVHDRVNQKQLSDEWRKTWLWFYPTNFTETYCCAPDTQVTTRTGMKPIQAISVGEEVKTHQGDFKKVTQVMKNEHHGALLSIKTRHLPHPLVVTTNHPVLKLARNRVRLASNNFQELEWVQADTVAQGDFFAIPKDQGNDTALLNPGFGKDGRIPEWVKSLSPGLLSGFVGGVDDTVRTSNSDLIWDLNDCYIKCGIPSEISYGEGTYSITRLHSDSCVQDTRYMYYPVESVETIPGSPDGFVYNLEVEDHHSYLAQGVAVHNCITAKEAQASFTPMLTSDVGALNTTVGEFGKRVLGHPYSREARQEFINEIVRLYEDKDYWRECAENSGRGYVGFDWQSTWNNHWSKFL